MNRQERIAARLDRLADVPTEVLASVVVRDGLCFWVFDRAEMPALTGTVEPDPDRELAAELCAGCPVVDECLELELRTSGPDTVGVWGGLCDTDRRDLYPLWAERHIGRRPRGVRPDESATIIAGRRGRPGGAGVGVAYRSTPREAHG